jgi:outer membrane protein assembly factor BamE (lipoprotein component of BamABCDE complex)
MLSFMKREKKVVLGIISLVVVFGLSIAICEWKVTRNFAKGIFGPGKTTAVNLDGWKKMRVGMTQEEVIKLLGDSSSKRKFTISGDSF